MDENADRIRDLEMRRGLLNQAAAIAVRWKIEKPTVYIPGPLDEVDEQQLAKQFRVIREPRPVR
jgi:hypothetical protein